MKNKINRQIKLKKIKLKINKYHKIKECYKINIPK